MKLVDSSLANAAKDVPYTANYNPYLNPYQYFRNRKLNEQKTKTSSRNRKLRGNVTMSPRPLRSDDVDVKNKKRNLQTTPETWQSNVVPAGAFTSPQVSTPEMHAVADAFSRVSSN